MTNIFVGKKAPSSYLAELQQSTNPSLEECLPSHLIPEGMIADPTWNDYFRLFLDERAERLAALIEKYVVEPVPAMAARFGSESETSIPSPALTKPRLKDLIASGKIRIGEQVCTRKRPLEIATIVDGDYVDYRGERLLINTWGQRMTGWSSISIYDSVLVASTGRPLKELRDPEPAAQTRE